MQGSISLRVKYSRERTHRRNLFRHVKKERKKSKVAEGFATAPKRGKNHKAPKQDGEIHGKFLREARVESQGSSCIRFLCVFVARCEEGFRSSHRGTGTQRIGSVGKIIF